MQTRWIPELDLRVEEENVSHGEMREPLFGMPQPRRCAMTTLAVVIA
jgi:hypothetical protein